MPPNDFMKECLKHRARKPDQYKDMIVEWLTENPDMSAAQLYDWCKEHSPLETLDFQKRSFQDYVKSIRTIGVCHPENFKFFPDAELSEGGDIVPGRSSCQHIGAYLVIRKIVAEYQLDKMADIIFGKDGGLFLDLAA